MSRLSATRDVSLVAAGAALVGYALDDMFNGLLTPYRRGTETSPLLGRSVSPDPSAPYGGLQPIGGRLFGDTARPALRDEAEAYTRARRLDPAGLVARTYDGSLVLPGQPGYSTALGYFHVTTERTGGAPSQDVQQPVGYTPAGSGEPMTDTRSALLAEPDDGTSGSNHADSAHASGAGPLDSRHDQSTDTAS
jgi:hypothetical protein